MASKAPAAVSDRRCPHAGNRYDLVVAGMVMIGVIGLLLDVGMRNLEKIRSLRVGVFRRTR